MFTVGLYAIVAHGLNLYTGKIGYALDNKPSYLLDLLIIWIGNFFGTFLTAKAISITRISNIADTAKTISEIKLNDNLLSILILSIFCGILMYIAVEGYKRANNPLILFICVSVFILCGFEHCVANMFYFSLAGIQSFKPILYLIVMTAGNSIGGLLIPLAKRIIKKEE